MITLSLSTEQANLMWQCLNLALKSEGEPARKPLGELFDALYAAQSATTDPVAEATQ